MGAAQPNDVQLLGVVIVVPVRFRIPANYARAPLEGPPLEGPLYRASGPGLLWVFRLQADPVGICPCHDLFPIR